MEMVMFTLLQLHDTHSPVNFLSILTTIFARNFKEIQSSKVEKFKKKKTLENSSFFQQKNH